MIALASQIPEPRLYLPTVTLCALTSIKLPETIAVLHDALRQVEFGQTLLVTHLDPRPLGWHGPWRRCREITSLSGYSRRVFHGLRLPTPHVLLVQHDSRLLNPDAWTNDFLQYDYLGAPWPAGYLTPEVCVGNGGFSLRSVKLLAAVRALRLELRPPPHDNEDANLCLTHRQALEQAGCRFAPPHLAARFSRELPLPPEFGQDTPFGTHQPNPDVLRALAH